MNPEKLQQFFVCVENGSIMVRRETPGTPGDLNDCFGDVTFTASHGWKITVFFDMGEWDYIDNIEVDGVTHGYYDNADLFDEIRPSTDVRRQIFGEPGYGGRWA